VELSRGRRGVCRDFVIRTNEPISPLGDAVGRFEETNPFLVVLVRDMHFAWYRFSTRSTHLDDAGLVSGLFSAVNQF
jgi:hypothetical protein